ncbi:MAG: ATP-dependent Clp protease adaptor ClpS [Chloroflexota bacterium]|nr:ATP-dependent Clp protease adaptor ClpS [Chloroflexota bacterium]
MAQAPTAPGTGVELDLERLARVRQLRPHKVIVLDCQCHSFDDVELALCRVLPGMTRSRAHEHAWEIHTTGASVVATAALERAEHYCSQLARRGLRVRLEEDS